MKHQIDFATVWIASESELKENNFPTYCNIFKIAYLLFLNVVYVCTYHQNLQRPLSSDEPELL